MPEAVHRRKRRRQEFSALLAVVLLAALRAAPTGRAGAAPAPASASVSATSGAPTPAGLHPAGATAEEIRIGPGERLLVIAPHPDDETLGAGGLAQRVLERGGKVRILLLTAGDGYVDAVRQETGQSRPRAEEFIAYGERRLGEARAAARELGRGISVETVGFPDGGLDQLLRKHMRRGEPERSATTGASDPPYDDEALDPDLPYDGVDLRHAMARTIREARPTIVAMPDPADVHPDHRATAAFSLLALGDVLAEPDRRPGPPPRVFTCLIHWPGWPPGWDRTPSPQDADLPLDRPADLPSRGLVARRLTLGAKQIAHKRSALAQYATQVDVMPEFLGAFLRRDEVFGEIPVVDEPSLARLLATVRPAVPTAPAPAALPTASAPLATATPPGRREPTPAR